MNKLNGRLQRLEAAAPPPADDDGHDALIDFCQRVIVAIDAGEIVDQTPGFKWNNFLSPTTADDLTGDDYSEAYSLLFRAQNVTREIATQSGWRSAIGLADHRSWKHYRANSAGELRAVMELIINAS